MRSLKLRNVHNGLITEIHNITKIYQHDDNFTEVLYTYEGSEYQYHFNRKQYEPVLEVIAWLHLQPSTVQQLDLT